MKALRAALGRELGLSASVRSLYNRKYLEVRDVAIVLRNGMYPVDNLDAGFLAALKERYRKVFLVTSSPVNPKFFDKYKEVLKGVHVIYTKTCYRRVTYRWIMERVKQIASDLARRGVLLRVVKSLATWWSLIRDKVIGTLTKVAFRLRMLPKLWPNRCYSYQVKGRYYELHLHGDGAYLCELAPPGWIITRLTNHQVQELFMKHRLKRLPRNDILCKGLLAPEWFKCECR